MSSTRKSTAAKSASAAVVLPPGRAGFTPDEAAEALAVSRSQIYELLKRGDLIGFHIGRAHRITAVSLAEYVDRQVAAEAQKPQTA
jgi:excisionase family DNA binding protein